MTQQSKINWISIHLTLLCFFLKNEPFLSQSKENKNRKMSKNVHVHQNFIYIFLFLYVFSYVYPPVICYCLFVIYFCIHLHPFTCGLFFFSYGINVCVYFSRFAKSIENRHGNISIILLQYLLKK